MELISLQLLTPSSTLTPPLVEGVAQLPSWHPLVYVRVGALAAPIHFKSLHHPALPLLILM